MERWKQYGSLLGLIVAFVGLGLWGFTVTGGALPYGKRSALAIQRGTKEGSGPLVDFGRGIVIADPIRRGGLVLEWFGLLILLAVLGIGLYVYIGRTHSGDGPGKSR